jgi:hypothetical protein
MPFGLCNAPATVERLMETVLAGLQWDICLIYLDDVIIYGKNVDEMIRNLSLVFDEGSVLSYGCWFGPCFNSFDFFLGLLIYPSLTPHGPNTPPL